MNSVSDTNNMNNEDISQQQQSNWLYPGEKGFDEKRIKNDIRAYRTPYSGSIILIVSVPYNKTYDNLEFLIDLYKVGIKDIIVVRGARDKIINRMEERETEIVRLPIKEALFLLVRGYRMAQETGYPIRKETKRWLRKLGVSKMKIKGSPFRCYSCERGRLDEATISYIKEVAKEDYNNGVLGSPDEQMIYFVCDDCEDDDSK